MVPPPRATQAPHLDVVPQVWPVQGVHAGDLGLLEAGLEALLLRRQLLLVLQDCCLHSFVCVWGGGTEQHDECTRSTQADNVAAWP